MDIKVCNKCKKERYLSQYGLESRSGKIKTICKVCQSNYNKQRIKYKRNIDIKSKICKKCKSEKDTIEFSDNYLIKDGISNTCKKCCVEKSKEYKCKNEEKVSNYQKKYKKEYKMMTKSGTILPDFYMQQKKWFDEHHLSYMLAEDIMHKLFNDEENFTKTQLEVFNALYKELLRGNRKSS